MRCKAQSHLLCNRNRHYIVGTSAEEVQEGHWKITLVRPRVIGFVSSGPEVMVTQIMTPPSLRSLIDTLQKPSSQDLRVFPQP